MLKDTTVIRFRQPDAIDDPLTELARSLNTTRASAKLCLRWTQRWAIASADCPLAADLGQHPLRRAD